MKHDLITKRNQVRGETKNRSMGSASLPMSYNISGAGSELKACTMNRRAFAVRDAEVQMGCVFAVQDGEQRTDLLLVAPLLPCQAQSTC